MDFVRDVLSAFFTSIGFGILVGFFLASAYVTFKKLGIWMTEDFHKIEISKQDLMDLIYWARRYCDKRMTGAPSEFNCVYKRLRSEYPDLMRCQDLFDKTLMDEGAYWPYAQDGMYNAKTGRFDARDECGA